MCIKVLLLSIPLVFQTIAPSAARESTLEADFVFENVNLVPLNVEDVLENRAVAVRNGKIVAIVDQASSATIEAPVRIDADGQFLMPGLTDMHIHMRMNPRAAFNLFLANGVTTVFNMRLADRNGDIEIDHRQLREDVKAGRMDGPRYLISGPQLHAHEVPSVRSVDSVLDEHVTQAYDTVKVHGPLDSEVYDYLIERARDLGIRVTGHAQHFRPLSHSLRQNAIEHLEEFLYVSRDSAHGKAAEGSLDDYLKAYFPHADRMSDRDYRAQLVREVADSGVYVTPTLIIYKYILIYVSDDLFSGLQSDERLAYLPEDIRDRYLNAETNEYRTGFATLFAEYLGSHDAVVAHTARNFETLTSLLIELYEANVPLLLGTDSFGAAVPGFSLHQELEIMVDAGLTPFQALRTGTVNVAAYLGETDISGTVEVGKHADFVLVSGNPLSDIRNVSDIQGVFSNGRWRSSADLARMLDEARKLSAE